jgi:UDP:flavonoid glycosyltransferase YjiC (YdhE family)
MPPNFDAMDQEDMFRRTMDGARASEYVLRTLCLPHTRAQYDALLAAARGADVIVGHPLGYAAPVAAEKLGIPYVSTALQPLINFSASDPGLLPNAAVAFPLMRAWPGFARFVYAMGRAQTRSWMEPVDRLRREEGLAPARAHPMFEVSPRLHLCLFSSVLAAPQPDWPPSSVQTGFAFYDKGEEGLESPPGLDEFLAEGEPPIVFTLGSSAVMTAGDFYRISARVAGRLGRRAVLLIGRDPRNALSALPAGVRAFEYAAYSRLFPRAAAIVHQGGAGTTAQALRAGKPMLIVPFAHDQPDHAERIVRQGLGLKLDRGWYTEERVTGALERLLADRDIASRTEAAGVQVRGEDGAGAAATCLEGLETG